MCKTIGLVKINEFCYGFDDRSNIYVSEYDFHTGDYSKLYVVTPRHDGVRSGLCLRTPPCVCCLPFNICSSVIMVLILCSLVKIN